MARGDASEKRWNQKEPEWSYEANKAIKEKAQRDNLVKNKVQNFGQPQVATSRTEANFKQLENKADRYTAQRIELGYVGEEGKKKYQALLQAKKEGKLTAKAILKMKNK